jgi:large subunit ribosomal protein L5
MTERRGKRAAVEEPAVVADETMDEAPMGADVEGAATEPQAADVVTEAAPEAAEAAAAPEAAPAADDVAAAEEAPAADDAEEPDAEAQGAAPDEVPAAEEAPAAAEPDAAVQAEEQAEAGEPIAAAVAEPAAEPEAPAAPAETGRPARSRDAKASAADAPLRPSGARGLQVRYRTDVVPAMVKQFEYGNPNQVPRLDKIVVNIGIGEALTNAKAIDAASGDLTQITGQKPIVQRARRSIAQFKIRAGNPIGLKVTLRGPRMWDFLERLTMLALPRIRDFRGTPSRSFDGRGNYTLGLREQIAFPEIDYDKVDRLRGLEVSIVTTAKSDEESKRLLELLGMPFSS